jgi:hypothetical protein
VEIPVKVEKDEDPSIMLLGVDMKLPNGQEASIGDYLVSTRSK